MIVGGLPHATGITANPNNGHLFVSTYDGGNIWDVDPIAKTVSTFEGVSADGLSTDGSVLYAEVGGAIAGYRLSDGVQVFNSGGFGDGADGTALGTGVLSGNIFVNTNGGNLWEVNLTTNARTEIGTGGSRGDFVTVDPNGTLLLTQTDRVLRLSAPNGGGFGNVPEPGNMALLVGSMTGAGFLLRRRRK